MTKRPQNQPEKATHQTVAQHEHQASSAQDLRVSERLHKPQASSNHLQNKAANILHHLNQGTSTVNPDVAMRTSNRFIKLAAVLESHANGQTQLLPSTINELRTTVNAHIKVLEHGIKTLAQMSDSDREQYSDQDLDFQQQLDHSLAAEKELLIQIRDAPSAESLTGKFRLNEIIELKRLGYPITPNLAKESSSYSDKNNLANPDAEPEEQRPALERVIIAGKEKPVPTENFYSKPIKLKTSV